MNQMLSETRKKKIETVAKNRFPDVTIVLVDIHDPHNAAAILRSTDAFGIQTVHFVFEKETPYDPAEIGKATSSSANKWLTYHTYNSTKTCFSKLKSDGYSITGTVLATDAQSIYSADLTGKLALVFGNEKDGLSPDVIQKLDRKLTIPMRGFVQSLNVSVAAGIILYEITRQRLHQHKPATPIPYAKTLAALLETANRI